MRAASTEAVEAAEAAEQETSAERRPVLRRLWEQPLWAHAAVLLVVLVALLPVMSPRSSFSSDEGAYALQVEALEHGSWAYEYKAAPYDPDGSHFPIYLSTRSGSGYFPYVKHPAYPLLLRAAREVAGPTLGLHLLALLGTVGTALAAWLLAGEVNPRLRRPTFWLAATGPVLVNGFLLWAHAPSAALAGLATVGAARIARRGWGALPALAVAASLAAGALLRSEGLLFAAALAAALAWIHWRQGRGVRSGAALLLAVPAGLAALAEHAWIGRIIGERFDAQGVRPGQLSYASGRLWGAWHELFHPPGQAPEAALPMLLATVLVAGFGYVALRRWGPASFRGLTMAAAGVLALLVIRLALHAHEPVTGLFEAWPIGLLGLLLVGRRRTSPAIVLMGVTVLFYVTSVLLTQYPEGGATEWGGRFLSPVLTPLAVLAAYGLATAVDAFPSLERRRLTSLLAVVSVGFAGFALVTVGSERARVGHVAEAVARHPAPVTLTTGSFLPRAGWAVDDRVNWMHVENDALARTLEDLRAKGLRRVAVLLPMETSPAALPAFRAVEGRPEAALAAVGLRLFVVNP